MDFTGYKSNRFDVERLWGFARHVAEARRGTPSSTLMGAAQETVRVKKFFGSREERRVSYRESPAPGWFLVVDPYEGWKRCERASGYNSYTRGFEEGRLLLLAPDGELSWSHYQIDYLYPLSSGEVAMETRLTDLQPATPQVILDFDRINRSSYRERRPQRSEVWRYELGRNFRIKYPHPGMETSLALKRFKEHGTHVSSLEIRA